MLKLQISQCCHLIVFFRSVGDLSGSKYDKWFLIEPEHFWDLASNINLFQLAFFHTCLTREACGCHLLMPGRGWSSSFLLPLLTFEGTLLLLPSRVGSYGSLPDLIYRSVLVKVLTLLDLLWDHPSGDRLGSLFTVRWRWKSVLASVDTRLSLLTPWGEVLITSQWGWKFWFPTYSYTTTVGVLGWLIVSRGWMSRFPTWPLQE